MARDDLTDEKLAEGKFLGRFVLEIIGIPKDHVKQTMETYVAKLKEDDDLEFVKEFIAEPVEKGKVFVIYAELEIWIKGLEKLFAFCLDAMPSSVEILNPDDFTLKARDFSNLLNDLQAKLHEVDLVVKQLRVKNKTLDTNAKAILTNLIVLSVKKNGKSAEQIAGEAGVKEEVIKPFLDDMVDKGLIVLEDDRWYNLKDDKKRG